MSEHPVESVGVVLVHGVGDPKLGETLDSVVEGLCGRNKSLIVEASARRVLTTSHLGAEIVVPQRRLMDKASGATIFVSEVFWGDVGRVSGGWWGSLRAVIALAMGLHALIFAGGGVGTCCRTQQHLPCFQNESVWFRATFWLAFVSAYHIKGVLMPLALAILLLVLFSLVAPNGTPPPHWLWVFFLPIAGLLARFWPARARERGQSTGAQNFRPERERWVVPTLAAGIWCVVGYVVPICVVLLARRELGPDDGWVVGLVLSLAFSLCHTVVILFTVRSDWQSGRRRRAVQAATWAAAIPWVVLTIVLLQGDNAIQMMSGLGSLLLSAYHLALGLAAVAVIALAALWLLTLLTSKEDHSERARSTIIFLGYGFEFALWAVIATILGGLAGQLDHQERLAWLPVENAYGRESWFPLVPLAFVCSLGATMMIDRCRHGSRFEIAHLVKSWPLPVVMTVTALACVAAVATELSFPYRWQIPPPHLLTTLAALIVPGVIYLVRWFQEPLHHALDLATDVALYFRGRSWASNAYHRTDELLRARFLSVAEDLLTDARVCRLVVAAHSQGTLIAADAMRGWTNAGKVDLLTMGSPLSDLYMKFFPSYFRGLVPTVRTEAKSWVNLYRKDDYVGRCLGNRVSDKQIKGTGHDGYWTDARVLAELERVIGL